MEKVILGVTLSLDGFAEDSNGSVGALYPDLEALSTTDVLREAQQNTGAVIMAWKEFTMQMIRTGLPAITSSRYQYLFWRTKHPQST